MEYNITEAQAAQYNLRYQRGLQLVRPNILIDGEPQSGRPGWLARRRLQRGIEEFKAALDIAPFKWECRFWIGKALQRLGLFQESMGWFAEALGQEPANPTIAKEAANVALELGQFQAGIAFLRPAVADKPSDPDLHYNLGIHLLLAGRAQDAYRSLQQSARLRAHRDTARLMTYAEVVISGRRTAPRTLKHLQQDA